MNPDVRETIEQRAEQDCCQPDSAWASVEVKMRESCQAQGCEPNRKQAIFVPNKTNHILAFHLEQHLADVAKITEIYKTDCE